MRGRRYALGGLFAVVTAIGFMWLSWSLPSPLPLVDGLRLEAPRQLIWLGLLPLLWWAISRPTSRVEGRPLFIVLRSLLIGLLVLALAQPVQQRLSDRVSVIFVLDVSDSVRDADIQDALAVISGAWRARRADDDVQVLVFAAHATALDLTESSEPGKLAIPELRAAVGSTDATDLAAAMRLAYGRFPPGHVRRLVLMSDGQETRGQLFAEAARARSLAIELRYHPMRRGPPPEVAITAMALPDTLRVGERTRIRAEVFATEPTTATLRLYQDGLPNALDSGGRIRLERGRKELSFETMVRRSGHVTYRLELEPDGPDQFDGNNRYAMTTLAEGPSPVLLVDSDPAQSSHLQRALIGSGYQVEVRAPTGFPRTESELARYDFVILSDVPAADLSTAQMRLVDHYVRERGGGFLMAGGSHGFGPGGYAHTPLEALLPVRMDAQGRLDEQSLALALVIDTSGSMSGQKIELAKEAARATAALLGPRDAIGVIGFASTPERVVAMQSARNRARIATDIDRLMAQGGTEIFPALDLAYQELVATRARVKHVILLTDGQAREQGIRQLVQAMHADAITVSVVGLGDDVHRQLLRDIAAAGGGRAYFTADPHHIPRIFTGEASSVTRSSVVEQFVKPLPMDAADFMHGLDLRRLPLLRGYVSTQARSRPAQTLLRSELGEPLLARWRVGLGWSLAWTSDVKSRWFIEWLRWSDLSKFWGQLVREHMRRDDELRLPMHAHVVGDELRVVVDAIDSDDGFLTDLDSMLTLQDVDGSTLATQPLDQVAPGRYVTRLPLRDHGSFLLQAVHRREGEIVARSRTQLSHPYPQEWQGLEVDEALLERAARLTGHTDGPGVAGLFDQVSTTVADDVPRWPLVLLCALFLFVLDVASRRWLLRRIPHGES